MEPGRQTVSGGKIAPILTFVLNSFWSRERLDRSVVLCRSICISPFNVQICAIIVYASHGVAYDYGLDQILTSFWWGPGPGPSTG